MNFSRYNQIVLGALGVLYTALFWYAFTLESAEGDLLRVGGLKASDFGHKSEQLCFGARGFNYYDKIEEWTAPVDVLVHGDSFSHQKGYRFEWQDFLVEETGLSLGTFHQKRQTVEEILSSAMWQEHPPKIFIWETVERRLHDRSVSFSNSPVPEKKDSVYVPPKVSVQDERELVPVVHDYSERTGASKMNYAIHHLKIKLLTRRTKGAKTIRLPLKEDHFFSNRRSQEIIVSLDDTKKNKLEAQDFLEIQADLENLRQRIEANGTTKAVFMVAPDKLTVYGPWLEDLARSHPGVLDSLPSLAGLPLPRLDHWLHEIVLQGVQDVYLPSDTHWGWIAHAEVGKNLARWMLQEGIVVAGEKASAEEADGPAIYAKQCALCHGETGDGQGIVPLDRPARSFVDGGFSFGNTSDALAKTIRNGIGGTQMPGFAEALTEEEIDAVVKVVQGFAPPALKVSAEETVLSVLDRPVVVRGHLPSVADGLLERPRGLLVGYANGFTFEYRADDLRLLAVRKGDFVDRTDWGGRGGTPLKPLGNVFWLNSDGDPACPWNIQGLNQPLRVQLTGTTVQENQVILRGELQDFNGGVFGQLEIVDELSSEVGGFVRHFQFTSAKGDYGLLFSPADGTQALSIPCRAGIPVNFQTNILLP